MGKWNDDENFNIMTPLWKRALWFAEEVYEKENRKIEVSLPNSNYN